MSTLRPLRRRYFTSPDILFRYHAGAPGLTTERSTPATYRDRSGVIRTAAPGVLRTTWQDGRPYALVEGASENLIPVERRKFEGWVAIDGAVVTVTQGQTIPGWSPPGEATRIQIANGTATTRYSVQVGEGSGSHTATLVVHNQGGADVRIRGPFGVPAGEVEVAPGETRLVRATVDQTDIMRRLDFRAAVGDDIDVIAYAPQIEPGEVATSYIPEATRDRDLVSVDYHHGVHSTAVLTAGREAGLGRVGQAHEWQIGASTDLNARALRIRRDGSEETLRLWLGSGSARVQSAVPVVPHGAEYQRLALLDVQGTEARVRLMQRHREGGAWVEADGGWSAWLDVAELLAQGWESQHLTIGNVREGSRAGRLQLSDLIALDLRGRDAEALTIDAVARRFRL